MVDTHRLEVHHIVSPHGELRIEVIELRLQVLLALLQAATLLLGSPGIVLLLIHLQSLIQGFVLLFHHLGLNPLALRDAHELVVRHDDTIIIIVLHTVEERLTILELLALGGRIQDAVIGVGSLICGGNLVDIGLHADDNGLVGQAKALHFMRGDTHDKGLTRTNFVIAYATAILQQHPHGILLGGIDILHTLLGLQLLQVKTGEGLVRTVILGPHEAVVLTVIHIRHRLLPFRCLLGDPLGETVADLVNEVCGQLNLVMVGTHDRVTVLLVAHNLVNDWRSVIEGMAQKLYAVIVLRLTMDGVLVTELRGQTTVVQHELIQVRDIGDLDVMLEELRSEHRKVLGGHPTLTEVKIQLVKGDRPWHHTFQSDKALVDTVELGGIVVTGLLTRLDRLNILYLLIDIAGKELLGSLKAAGEGVLSLLREISLGVIIDTSLQLVEQLLNGLVGDLTHIVEIHTAGTVQGGGQRLLCRLNMIQLVGIESHRTMEDVRLDELTLLAVLDTQQVTAHRIEDEGLDILLLVQRTEAAAESIIGAVQLLTQLRMLLMLVALGTVECLIGITHRDIQAQALKQVILNIHRLEGRAIAHIGQHTHLVIVNDNDTVTIMRQELTVEPAWLHRKALLFLLVPHREEIQLQRGGGLCRLRLTVSLLRLGLRLWLSLHLDSLRLLYLRLMVEIQLFVEVIFKEAVKTLCKRIGQLLHRAVELAHDGKLSVLVRTEGMLTQIN